MPRGKKKVEEQTSITAPDVEAAKPTKDISKTAAVKRALAKLGRKAMPAAIHDFVLSKYGIEIGLSHISNIKSMLKAKKKNAVTAAKAEPEVTVNHVGNGRHTGDLSLEDIEIAKQLAQRVGIQQLHALIDLVAK